MDAKWIKTQPEYIEKLHDQNLNGAYSLNRNRPKNTSKNKLFYYKK